MRYSIFLLLVLTISACSDSREMTLEELTPLDGYHSLVEIVCECIPPEVTDFQQQWRFDLDNSIVDVVVIDEIEIGLILEQGRYEVTMIDTSYSWGGVATMLRFDNRDFFYNTTEQGITLSDPGAEVDAGSYYIFHDN